MARKKTKKETKEIKENILEVEFSEEMKESYSNYAFEVISARALPDIRDGLKPVQRRSIYSMYDLGVTYNKPYKKAGRMVGECFVKGTQVLYYDIENKEKRINNLLLKNIEDIEVGDYVETFKGKKKVTEIYIMPKKETLKVSTDIPFIENTCTLNQKFKIINENMEFEWKEAKDLKENDFIVSNGRFYLIKFKELNGIDKMTKENMSEFESLCIIPFLKENIILEFGEDFYNDYKNFFEKDNSIKRTQLFASGLYFKLKEKKFSKLNIIDTCAKNGLIFAKIKETIEDVKQETYDIQVEDIHEFVANGMYVHNCMGKYHPHGDSSIYEAMVVMAQDFKYNIPLIDGHGNWGSIDGDSSAAMRYTECRLSKITEEMTDGLKDKIVEFVPNFDEEEMEPSIFPCKFPNLLVNGCTGIAVGMATNIPTHNLRDTIKMIEAYIKREPNSAKRKNPITVEDLLNILMGPDFPTGGIITNKKDLLDIYSTGEGKIYVRAKIEEEKIDNKKSLIITEIPYTYSGKKSSLIERLSTIVLDKKIPEITEVRDESDKSGIRIILELKRDSDTKKVKNKLYKYSPLQDTFGVNLLALNDGEIKPFNLKEYCKIFLEFQEELYTKNYQMKKSKLERRIEILKGLIKANDFIDVIIDAIRHAEEVKYVEACLTTGNTHGIKFNTKKNEQIAKKFNFTEMQAENILETTLRRLNNIEVNSIAKNLVEIEKELAHCEKILSNKKELYKEILKTLNKIAKEYGRDRRTIIADSDIIEYKEEEKIFDMNIIFDKYGYIKAFDENNISKVDESVLDNAKIILKTTNNDNLWCFSSDGNLYQVRLNNLSFNRPRDRGILLEAYVNKDIKGDIIFTSNQHTEYENFLFITKKGFVKIVNKKEFETIRTITNATKLSKDDSLLKIIPIDKNDKQLLINTDENILKFRISEIPENKKTSIGVISIKTNLDIVDAQIVNEDEIILNNKKIMTSKIPCQKRGTKGVSITKLTK